MVVDRGQIKRQRFTRDRETVLDKEVESVPGF